MFKVTGGCNPGWRERCDKEMEDLSGIHHGADKYLRWRTSTFHSPAERVADRINAIDFRSTVASNGANPYTLRFEKGALPPAKEFWSLTMCDPAHNLIDNPINRYEIRDRTPGIKQDADGSTVLYLQSTSPGPDKESNWLPTPKQGAFSMALRTYGPGDAITNQTWQPPAVKRVQ